MIDLLLKPTPLSQHMDGYLHYGDTVQIVSPGPSCDLALKEHPFKRGHCRQGHLALSSTVPPSSIDNAPFLSTDSIISASPLLFPVVRNSFVIEHPRCEVGKVVNYGEVFRIRALPTQHFSLYLFAAPAIRLHHASTHSARPKVRFSDVKCTETLWTAHPIDAMDKLKMELGVPVSLKTRMYIKHNGTGIHLSTEPDFRVLTYFGNEYEVTVDTKFDRVRRPKYQNIWYFDTERGAPKPDECKKQFMEQSAVDASHNALDLNKSAAFFEKQKEDAKKEEDEQNQEDCEYSTQAEVCQIPLDEMKLRENMRQNDKPKDTAGGQVPYDWRTAPQPNAYTYRVFKDDPYFPNTKYSCGETDCCNLRQPGNEEPAEPKPFCECIEAPDPEPNPNIRDYHLKPLLR